MDKDSFIFYRSFKDSIKELSDEDKLIMYEAISDYGLNHDEPKLVGFPKALFSLIKPQLDANFKRWANGLRGGAPKGNKNNRYCRIQPKYNQDTTEVQPNENDNVNANVNANENDNENENVFIFLDEKNKEKVSEDYYLFLMYIRDNAPYIASHYKIMNEEEFRKLKEKYSGADIAKKIRLIENNKQKRSRYSNLLTTLEFYLDNNQ